MIIENSNNQIWIYFEEQGIKASIPFPGWDFILQDIGVEDWADAILQAIKKFGAQESVPALAQPINDVTPKNAGEPPETEEIVAWIKKHPGKAHNLIEVWADIRGITPEHVRKNYWLKDVQTRNGTRQNGSTESEKMKRHYRSANVILEDEGWRSEIKKSTNRPWIYTWSPGDAQA